MRGFVQNRAENSKKIHKLDLGFLAKLKKTTYKQTRQNTSMPKSGPGLQNHENVKDQATRDIKSRKT